MDDATMNGLGLFYSLDPTLRGGDVQIKDRSAEHLTRCAAAL